MSDKEFIYYQLCTVLDWTYESSQASLEQILRALAALALERDDARRDAAKERAR